MPDNIIGNLGQGTWEHRDDGNGNVIQVWVPSGPPPEPPELVVNGNFETGDLTGWTDWGMNPWTVTSYEGSYKATAGTMGDT